MEPRTPGLLEIALCAIVGLRDLINVLERRQVTAARDQG
jgi:hypothetical protein